MDFANLDTTWLIAGLLVLAVVAFSLALAGWRRSQRRQQEAIPPAFDPKPDLEALGLSTARPVSAPLPAAPSERHAFKPHLEDDLDEDPSGDEVAVETDEDGRETIPTPSDETAWMPPQDGEAEPDALDDDTPEEEYDLDDDDTPILSDDPEPLDDVTTDLEMETDVPVTFDDAGVSAPRPVMKPPPARTRPHPHLADTSPLWPHIQADAVGALLESLWVSLGAQSVALLRHDEARDVFAVEALASRDGSLHTDPFPARNNALRSLTEDESALAVLEGEALASLRYHMNPRGAVGHAVALPLPGAPSLLLIADGALSDAPFTGPQMDVMSDYADLFGRLLQRVPLHTPPPTTPDGDPAAAPPVRTRADIITEEMAAARAHERPLALALVVPQNSEEIAAKGAEAIAEAEQQLTDRLRSVEGSARVERFGENMIGVFCHAGPAFVEAWAERVHVLGPPVFIGVSLLRARHSDADALRDAAAAALYEAYESGKACVILE